MDFLSATTNIAEALEKGLSPLLTYHSGAHTHDVVAVAGRLCREHGLSDYETSLVLTAAYYHDAGFLETRVEHEAAGCALVTQVLPGYGYTNRDIGLITGMIRATKIPQSPQNLYEAILCDADLDYLGRTDFYDIGQTLFEELKNFGVLDNGWAWNNLQVKFLKSHIYHTHTQKLMREPQKQQYLCELEQWLDKNRQPT